MSTLRNCLLTAAATAGGVYFFDPQLGRRRRALVYDQLVHAKNRTIDRVNETTHDLAHRISGTAAELAATFTAEQPSDEILCERARARLGHYVSHPSAIEVTAREGNVVLSGHVLAHEAKLLLRAISKVRGVRNVEDHLEAHETEEEISEVHGNGRGWFRNWSSGQRLAAGALGGGLLVGAARRAIPVSLLAAGVGIGACWRAIAKAREEREVGAGRERREPARAESTSGDSRWRKSRVRASTS
jgi:hypothetical protein